jgi:hypothetical protein
LDKLLLPLLRGDPTSSRSGKRTLQYPKSIQEPLWTPLFPPTYAEVHSTSTLFLMVTAAVIPTSVFPAPQGSTIMPERARLGVQFAKVNTGTLFPCVIPTLHQLTYPLPNILLSEVSWYGLITVMGFKSISRFAFTVSALKSYSSSTGRPMIWHCRFTLCSRGGMSKGIRVSKMKAEAGTYLHFGTVNFERLDPIFLVHLVRYNKPVNQPQHQSN